MGPRYQSGSRLAAKPRLSGSAHRQGPWCRAYRSAPVLILPPFFTASVPCTVFFAATDFLQSSLHSKLRSPDTGSGLARQASVRSGALTDVPLRGEIGEVGLEKRPRSGRVCRAAPPWFAGKPTLIRQDIWIIQQERPGWKNPFRRGIRRNLAGDK